MSWYFLKVLNSDTLSNRWWFKVFDLYPLRECVTIYNIFVHSPCFQFLQKACGLTKLIQITARKKKRHGWKTNLIKMKKKNILMAFLASRVINNNGIGDNKGTQTIFEKFWQIEFLILQTKRKINKISTYYMNVKRLWTLWIGPLCVHTKKKHKLKSISAENLIIESRMGSSAILWKL